MLVSSMLNRLESKIKVLDVIYPENKRNTEQYDSIIMLRDIWEYTLVLPSEIAESDFSGILYLSRKCFKINKKPERISNLPGFFII